MDRLGVLTNGRVRVPRAGARRRSRRWLRLLCLVAGVAAALAAVFGLLGVMLFSRFGAVFSGPSWWYGLRPLELAGVAPKAGLWWLGLVGWALIGLAGLLLMARAGNLQRRPPLLSSVLLVVCTILATVSLARALYVRPGKVMRIASLSRLEQLTGMKFPANSQLVAGGLRTGEGMQIRAVVTMPRSAALYFAVQGSGVWPADASVQTTDRAVVLETMAEADDRWDLPGWAPQTLNAGIASIVVYGPRGAEWQVAVLSDDPVVGDARVLLDCRQ